MSEALLEALPVPAAAAAATPRPVAVPTLDAPATARRESASRDYLTLTKPGISVYVLATTCVSYYCASPEGLAGAPLAHALLGTALGAGGANALNMYLERDADARMQRTRRRPLPAGRLAPAAALAFGLALCVGGDLYLAATVNTLTALLCLASQASYLLAYTPLKRRTTLNTVIGAVPGAIPALMGWSAATGDLPRGAWCLFAILVLWQLPHFLAIAWRYRADYARGGFAMLPIVDPDGAMTGRQVLLQSQALLLASLAPALIGLAGPSYFAGALALGVGFLGFGLAFALLRSEARARRLFLASIVYLPALLALLAVDKVAALS
ncbi:MAG: protoheme IX farnesyltransferase [Planctomycetes bacterium]|nr:protoheme IX farnesyltransferase [Planctomycetota bacterium]